MPERRSENITVRFKPSELAFLREAAERADEDVTAYIRTLALAGAGYRRGRIEGGSE